MQKKTLCLIRGGGDLATGVGYRLFRSGFPIIVTELAKPLAVRRTVSFAEAVYTGDVIIEGLVARRVSDPAEALQVVEEGSIPVLVDVDGEFIPQIQPMVLVDARMAKVNIDSLITDAPLVIGLGPGFTAGEYCHAVVETKRGHHLGRVKWQGTVAPDDGIPEPIIGYAEERVLRAPAAGELSVLCEIGELVSQGETLAEVQGEKVLAPFAGVLRGIIHHGVRVTQGMKIGDVDPRGIKDYCFQISDKALAIGGGVLEAMLTWLNTNYSEKGLFYDK